jgi:hypothetical protein
MKLRTDDDIYRARLVYLGPPGYTFPFQLRYAQYGLFIVLAAGFTAAAVMLTGTLKSAGVALAAAIFMTYLIWRQVDPDRPVRAVIRVALTDWRSIQPPKDQMPRLTARHIRFSEIEGGTTDAKELPAAS